MPYGTPPASSGPASVSGALGAATLAVDQASTAYARPRNQAEAARQFEALLIAQTMRTAHESSTDGAIGSGEDSSSETMWDLATQQFAQVLANNGGLGLARLVAQGLTPPVRAKLR